MKSINPLKRNRLTVKTNLKLLMKKTLIRTHQTMKSKIIWLSLRKHRDSDTKGVRAKIFGAKLILGNLNPHSRCCNPELVLWWDSIVLVRVKTIPWCNQCLILPWSFTKKRACKNIMPLTKETQIRQACISWAIAGISKEQAHLAPLRSIIKVSAF